MGLALGFTATILYGKPKCEVAKRLKTRISTGRNDYSVENCSDNLSMEDDNPRAGLNADAQICKCC